MNIELLSSDPSYIAYMKKVDGMVNGLPRLQQQEIQNEIRSHLYESLRHSPDLTVDVVLQNFGAPEAYLPEWVIVKKMEIAARSFDPIRILKALFLGIRRHSIYAFKYILFVILYVLTFTLAALCIFKIVAPSKTGLMIHPHGFNFGFNSEIVPGSYEVLGWWFIPICLFSSILLYLVITVQFKNSLPK